ncbi:hypothetical protein BpHYR1_046347 [Brachionus plicatilis]|uniref:Uncharacterized protein n=1 Tax=Brachionus plicatilis TaxID=10195 RepID=A0A3M7PYX4_BRAPC|nr:hypothetical protein BpHYR1_046347 [Brachionus plicatilis]
MIKFDVGVRSSTCKTGLSRRTVFYNGSDRLYMTVFYFLPQNGKISLNYYTIFSRQEHNKTAAMTMSPWPLQYKPLNGCQIGSVNQSTMISLTLHDYTVHSSLHFSERLSRLNYLKYKTYDDKS